MNKDELLYKISKNKSKLLLASSILFLIAVIIVGIIIVRKNNSYKLFNGASSSKYILASNIISASQDGNVNLYSSSNGKLVDELKLDGNFLIDMSDDFSSLYMLNTSNGEIFKLSSDKDKIKKESETINIQNSNSIDSFDYDNGSIVGLYNDKKSFFVKYSGFEKCEKFLPGVESDIDLFRIVNDNLVFTSGEFIYSKSLSKDASNSDSLKVTKINLKLRDKENIHGNIVSEIPSGEKIKILGQGETGWYLVEYKGAQGYVSNASGNFEESNTNDGGLVKIHIGETSSYLHESNNELFIHNNFGQDRGTSILLEINPNTLSIKNLIQFNNITNSLISNSKDSRVYVNELAQSNNDKIRQIIKYGDFKEYEERLGFKYTSKTILDNLNTYGMLGYVYYKDEKGVNIFNLKSQEKDLTINIDFDFFAPLY